MKTDATRPTVTLQGTTAADFQTLGLRPELLRAVQGMGFARPTEVQVKAIPPALEGRDLLACAMTGSGKTAAYLLPILQRLQAAGPGRTRALVLTPTRELAAQVGQQLQELARHARLTGAVIHGGVGMAAQEKAIRTGVDVIVATPGRLLDHFRQTYGKLPALEVLVLDEADRMLDMGFLPDVRRIVAHLPRAPRQTLLFSATLPPSIIDLSRELMTDPLRVGVAGNAAPPRQITQALYPVPALLKPELLAELLQSGEIGNAIVFCRTKHRADRLAQKLEKRGFAATRIHGNRSQAQRTSALDGFKRGRFRVLVATDIVARGIDVAALGHVVNFDVPAAPEDYIHRIGRTARAEAAGEAFTFVAPEEEQDVRGIERALGFPLERRTVEGFAYGAQAVRAAAAAEPSSRRGGAERPARNQRRGRGTLRASG